MPGNGRPTATKPRPSTLIGCPGGQVLTPTVGRSVNELLRQVKAYQYVRATGEVAPAGWEPGKPTLKPSPDLVGKVWKVWSPKDE